MSNRDSDAEINPYAAPRVADPLLQLGIRAWRSGPLLVTHVRAELPQICVVSAAPAAGAREWHVTWKSPGDVLSRQAVMMIPLRRDLLDRFSRARSRARLGMLLTVLGVLALIVTGSWILNDAWRMLALAAGGVALLVVGLLTWSVGMALADEPLKVERSNGDYLWLSGADEQFLTKLPQYPLE
ncbi:MAG: hypothetical protein SFU86_18375 [Pirellulaceae bacterium]|nr:hypothetical protein [Pirellulaceae bacterium]